jgi:hypothetical protein
MRAQHATPSPKAAHSAPSRTGKSAVGEASGISDCPRAGGGEGRVPVKPESSNPKFQAPVPKPAKPCQTTPKRAITPNSAKRTQVPIWHLPPPPQLCQISKRTHRPCHTSPLSGCQRAPNPANARQTVPTRSNAPHARTPAQNEPRPNPLFLCSSAAPRPRVTRQNVPEPATTCHTQHAGAKRTQAAHPSPARTAIAASSATLLALSLLRRCAR